MGSIIGGFQSQIFGRKKSLILSSLCFFAAITCLRFSGSLPVLLLGRFLMGYAGGSEMPASSAYTAEICHPNTRKFTGTFGMVLYTVGYATIYSLGVFLNWRDTLSVIIGWPLICAFILCFCPESPTWLMLHGNPKEASKAMLLLRGSKEDADQEITKLERNMEEQRANLESDINESWLGTSYKVLKQPTFLRPFLVVLVLMTFGMQLTGAPPLAFYLVPILQKSNIPISSYVAAASLASYRLVIVLISLFLSSLVPRRPLLMSTLFIAATGALLMATSSYLQTLDWFISFENDYPLTKWVPIIAIFFMYTGFSGGVGPVISILIGELLPSNLRSFGIGLVTVFSFGTIFVVLKFTPLAQELIGLHGMYWIFSSVGYGLMFFTFFFIPETFGRSLEDIEEYYRTLCFRGNGQENKNSCDLVVSTSMSEEGQIREELSATKVMEKKRSSVISNKSFLDLTKESSSRRHSLLFSETTCM